MICDERMALSCNRKTRWVKVSQAITDNCFQLKSNRITGDRPAGAKMRTRVGRSDNPDSATKTISRPSRWHFFLRWPGALLPVRDGRLVALLGPPLRLLAGETQSAGQPPDVHLAVPNAEATLDRLALPLDRPQLGTEAGRLRPGQQDAPKLLVPLAIELGRSAALAHNGQGRPARRR